MLNKKGTPTGGAVRKYLDGQGAAYWNCAVLNVPKKEFEEGRGRR
jgi:hypothetical protein